MLRTTEKSGSSFNYSDKFWISHSLPDTSGFLSKGKCPGVKLTRHFHPIHSFRLCVEMYHIFRVIPRRLNIMCRRFGTFCMFHLHRWCKQEEQGESLKSRMFVEIFTSLYFFFRKSEDQRIVRLFNFWRRNYFFF